MEILRRLDGKYQNRPEHEIDPATLTYNFVLVVADYVLEWFMDRRSDCTPSYRPDDGRCFPMTFRYHPNELPEIYPVVSTFLRARGSLIPLPVDAERSTETRTATRIVNFSPRDCRKTYVLLGATFSARSGRIVRDNVTAKIKDLVKSHFGCLVLHRYFAPAMSPEEDQWYYWFLFGDDNASIESDTTLSIRVLDPETGQKLTISLSHDASVALRLDFPDLDTAN